jgi:hypothetical protein
VFDLLEVGLCGFFLHGASGLMTHRLILVFLLKKNLALWFSLISFRLGYLDLMIWYADLTR